MKKLFLVATVSLIVLPASAAEKGASTRDLDWCFSSFPNYSQRDLQMQCVQKAIKDAAARGQAKGDERAAYEKEHPLPHRDRTVADIVQEGNEIEAEARARRTVSDVMGNAAFCAGTWAGDPWMASRCVSRLSP